jgi:hypothetical protein
MGMEKGSKVFLGWANRHIHTISPLFFFVFIIYILADFKHSTVIPPLERLELEVRALQVAVGSIQGEREIFLKILILKPSIDLELARRISKVVYEQSRLFNRDSDFVLAMIKHESNFDPGARSPVGAMGLMQVMPHWLEVLGADEDLTDITVSVRRGLQVYGFYEKTYNGSMEMALTAYNRGSWKVEEDIRLGRDPNNGYAGEVLVIYNRLKEMR